MDLSLWRSGLLPLIEYALQGSRLCFQFGESKRYSATLLGRRPCIFTCSTVLEWLRTYEYIECEVLARFSFPCIFQWGLNMCRVNAGDTSGARTATQARQRCPVAEPHTFRSQACFHLTCVSQLIESSHVCPPNMCFPADREFACLCRCTLCLCTMFFAIAKY